MAVFNSYRTISVVPSSLYYLGNASVILYEVCDCMIVRTAFQHFIIELSSGCLVICSLFVVSANSRSVQRNYVVCGCVLDRLGNLLG